MPAGTPGAPTKRQHFWIGNRAFTDMTGIRFVCMDCGLGVASRRDPKARESCPGRKEARNA